MASVKLLIRSDRKDLGTTTIYAQYTYKSDKKKFSTGRSVAPKQWDAEHQKVIGSSVEVQELNAHVQKVKGRLDKIIIAANMAEVEPTLEYVTEQFKGKSNAATPLVAEKEKKKAKALDFLELFEEYINATRATKAHGTYKHYKTTLNHLRSFVALKHCKLGLENIDTLFYYDFITFLTQVKKMTNGTANNQIKRVKVVMGYAGERGLTFNSSFRKFKRLPITQKPIVYLTQAELDLLNHFDLTAEPRHAKLRDMLVFACATGLRHSDFIRVTLAHVTDDTLRLRTIKTKEWTEVKLNSYSRPILSKYPEGFPKLSQQKFNSYVKELGKLCGINTMVQIVEDLGAKTTTKWVPKYELMSSHIGRKTFVTQGFERGMDDAVIMANTGHKDHRSMKPYRAIATEEKRKQMDKAWG